MAEGYKDFTAGMTLTAGDLEDYCEKQGIMRFASAAARNTALASVLTEGLLAYLQDVNAVTMYSGSVWSTLMYGHGTLPTWTPTVTQSGAVTVTVVRATYQRTGRWVQCTFRVSVTGSGTGGAAIVIGGLPFTAAYATGTVGAGGLYDVSIPNWLGALVCMNSTTTVAYQAGGLVSGADVRVGVVTNFTSQGLASSDVLDGTFSYEAAADA